MNRQHLGDSFMKKCAALAVVSFGCAASANAQGRPVDWPSYAGDARRTGWERSDTRITKENIKDFQLVLKRKFEKQQNGARALTPPVIIGLLISYKGFKELGFVAGNGGGLWSIDVDLDKMFWQKQLPAFSAKSGGSPLCSDGLTAIPTLTPPVTFGGRRPAARPPVTPPGTPVSPGQPATPAGRPAALPARLGGTGFGAPRPLYVLTSDGKLHQFNTSDGSDQYPPLNFLAANAKASTLTMNDNVIYTTTVGNCGSVANGVWAIDLAVEEPIVASFPLTGGAAGGTGGLAVGNDGTVYVQTGPGPSDPASGKWSNTLLALSGRDLKLKDQFIGPENASANSAPDMNVTTPVVFEHNGRDLIVSAGRDGRLYLLDSESLGGTDHKTPLHKTSQLSAGGATQGIWGGISTWEDADGNRWVLAPVWGPLSPEFKAPVTNGPTPNGAVVAFKVEAQSGKPALVPAWVSRDMRSPQPPVITSGVVFAVSAGGYARQGAELRPNNSTRATMYAFDGMTGKEMYSTGNQVSAPATLTGATVANGRVFFTTTDGTLYGFGIFLETLEPASATGRE
jgi:outer membrane protein assembly factor BamB